MAQRRSFQDYVANRFYDPLYDAVSGYLEQGSRDLGVTSRRVRVIDRAELSGIEVKRVVVHNLPGMRIGFDVLLEAEFEISETDRHDDRYDDKTQWFKVACSGDLSRNLDDFHIDATSVYHGKRKLPNPLSDSLVPIITVDEMEGVAQEFLQAERMGLSIQSRSITEDCSSFGQVVFRDCATEYYDPEAQEFKTVQVKRGTIIVDPEAFFLRNLGSMNYTIVHECVHWHLHRKAFELERLYNEQAARLECQVVGGMIGKTTRTDTDWMEWQANALAPRILMPLTQAKIKCGERIRTYLKEVPGSEPIDIMESVIDDVARFFGVSRLAAKIRMVEIGFAEAAGAFTYIDGRYVSPHTWKAGALKGNQTFAISERDAVFESSMNLVLREKIQRGDYLFVDAHFCLHDARYIAYDELGQPVLTDYARHHMDECCLVFELTVPETASRYGREFYRDCVLYRDASSDIIFEARFIDSKINDDGEAQVRAIRAYTKELADVQQNLPGTFSGALIYLMTWKDKLSVEKLAEVSGIDAKTIQRMRNNEDYQSTIETIVALCIGLQLPPELSYVLIDKSSCSLTTTEKHMTYRFLLNSCYTRTIYQCNDLLRGLGLAPLTKEK